MTRLILILLFTASLNAQTFMKIATEGNSTASSTNTLTLPAGATYQFGTAGHFCDPVTVTKATTISPIYVTSFTCTVNGVKTADPANGVVKEVDVEQAAGSQSVSVNGATVVVPAAKPKPVTCTSGTATTYTLTTSVTYNSGGFITAGSASVTCQ